MYNIFYILRGGKIIKSIDASFSSREVDLSSNLLSSFGKSEVETDVCRIIEYFKIDNKWIPVSKNFLKKRLGKFYLHYFETSSGVRLMDSFSYLFENGFIMDKDEFCPTERFFKALEPHKAL